MEVLMYQNKNVKVSQSSSMQEDKTKVFSYKNMGSWVHSILSPIYGDYHGIDKVYTIVMF